MNEPMIDPTSPTPMPIPAEIPDYVIAEEYSRNALEDVVVKLMARGWRPTGGVHVRSAPEWNHIYTQALTKGV